MLDPVRDGLVEDDVPGGQPRGHLGDECRVELGVLADDEPLKGQPAPDHGGQVAGADGHLGGVVLRDGTAQRGPPAVVEGPHRRLEVVAADVVEVDVDAAGSRDRELVGDRAVLVVERGVEAVAAREERDLLGRTGRADDAAGTLEPGDLADHRAHRSRGPGDEHAVSGHHRGHLEQPDVRRERRHPQHAEVRRDRHPRDRRNHAERASVALGHVAPPELVHDDVADDDRVRGRGRDAPHRSPGHDLAEGIGRRVGLRVVHPPTHVRVHRDELVRHAYLPRAEVGELDPDRAEVACRRPSARTPDELDLCADREQRHGCGPSTRKLN